MLSPINWIMSLLPKSYAEAIKHDCWKAVIQDEITALEVNHTWQFMDLPLEKILIDCKIVYCIKYKSNGEIEWCKVRIMAKGYTQQKGIDFMDTFSPVTKMSIVRDFLALVASNEWYLHQMDVNNAFLHVYLSEEICMNPSEGYHIPLGKILKLTKSLYGLKQMSM